MRNLFSWWWEMTREVFYLEQPGRHYAALLAGWCGVLAGIALLSLAIRGLGWELGGQVFGGVGLGLAILLLAVSMFKHVSTVYGRAGEEYRQQILADIDAARNRNQAREDRSLSRIDARALARGEELVYFIVDRGRGAVKIGYSRNPSRRVRDLQTSNAHPLELAAAVPGGWELERRLHQHYAPFHLSGEWYELTDDLAAHIAELAGDLVPTCGEGRG